LLWLKTENQDESTHKSMGETDEEVQDFSPSFDDDLDLEVNDIEIKEDDCVFIATVHLCQGTPAAYLPVTGQGCLNGCGSAKAG
jgi:hypothetical protein